MKHKLTLAVMTVLFTIGLSPVASYADPIADSIAFSLSNPNQTTVAGGTVTFQATVTADAGNTGTISLNFDTFNGADPLIPGDVYINDNDFFANFFFPSYNPGDAPFTDDLFTVTLPSDAPVGYVYFGTFTLQGGNDFTTDDNLGTVDFSVTVIPASTSAVPEPSSLMLLGTGLAGIFATFKRKAFQSVGA